MMKKMICALVACAMLLCAACAFAAPNPMVESSYSEILTKLGLGILAPGAAQEAQWFIIDDDLAQVGFSIYEIPYTLRAKAASAAEDISGMYFSSGDETKVDILWNEGSYRAEDGVGARVMWTPWSTTPRTRIATAPRARSLRSRERRARTNTPGPRSTTIRAS